MNDEPMQLPDSENPHAAEFAVLEALKNEVESLKDQRLRALAEVENVRRRAEKEKTEAGVYAVTKFARDMLGIADNFARALAAAPPALREAADPALKAVLDGVEATDRQLMQTLERYGVKAVDTADGKFDPNLHQAIAEVPGGGKPAGSGHRTGAKAVAAARAGIGDRCAARPKQIDKPFRRIGVHVVRVSSAQYRWIFMPGPRRIAALKRPRVPCGRRMPNLRRHRWIQRRYMLFTKSEESCHSGQAGRPHDRSS